MLSRTLTSNWSAFSRRIRPARVLHIEDDVGDDDRDNREAKDVEPTPVLAGCHAITSEQGTDEPKTEQEGVNDSRGVDLQRHRAGRGDVSHVV